VTIDNLGSLYHLDGQFDKALVRESYFRFLSFSYYCNVLILSITIHSLVQDLYNEAWDIKKETLGTKHADTVMMYGQIGRLYHDKGEVEKSLPFLETNLLLRQEILDLRHPQIIVAKSPLAALLVDLGKYEDALKLAKESVELRSDVLGNRHPYTAYSYDTLALAELGLGNIDAAEKAAQISADIRTDVLGPSHPRCAVAHMTLAKVRSAQGLGKEAIDEAAKAHTVNEAALRVMHPFRKTTEDLLRDMVMKHPA
jgi:tetratricopeptide (TPR) repeat protein